MIYINFFLNTIGFLKWSHGTFVQKHFHSCGNSKSNFTCKTIVTYICISQISRSWAYLVDQTAPPTRFPGKQFDVALERHGIICILDGKRSVPIGCVPCRSLPEVDVLPTAQMCRCWLIEPFQYGSIVQLTKRPSVRKCCGRIIDCPVKNGGGAIISHSVHDKKCC